MSASLHSDLSGKIAALKHAVDIIYSVHPDAFSTLGAIRFPSEVAPDHTYAASGSADEALMRAYHRLQALFIVRMFNIVIGVSSSRRARSMLVEIAERLTEAGLSDDIGGLRRVLSVWRNPAAATRVRESHERRGAGAELEGAFGSSSALRSP